MIRYTASRCARRRYAFDHAAVVVPRDICERRAAGMPMLSRYAIFDSHHTPDDVTMLSAFDEIHFALRRCLRVRRDDGVMRGSAARGARVVCCRCR